MTAFLARLAADRHLPLGVVNSLHEARRLVERTRAAGFGTLEIALRTPTSLEAIADIGGSDDVMVGAGTVRTPAQVEAAVEAGAAFVVTPGWQRTVVARCREVGIPVLPGVATPGEAMAAMLDGFTAAKFFPAAQLGGPDAVAAWAGPFPDLLLVPSGGVSRDMAGDYLAMPTVLAVSGSWVLE